MKPLNLLRDPSSFNNKRRLTPSYRDQAALIVLGIQIMQSRAMLVWHFRQDRDREALWRFGDLKVAAISAWGLAAEDLTDPRRIKSEIELGIVEAHIDIFAAFGIFVDIIIRYGEQLAPIDSQRLERLGKGVLMGVIADDQECQCFAERFVRAHFVDPRFLQDPGGFQHEIVQQVADQVAVAVHIVAVPRVARRIHREGALSAHNKMMRIRMLDGFVQRGTIGTGVSGHRLACTGEQLVDCMLNQFNVADLLQKDTANQVTVLGCCPPEVAALEKKLHHRSHLAKSSAQRFLNDFRRCGIRPIRNDEVNQIFFIEIHLGIPFLLVLIFLLLLWLSIKDLIPEKKGAALAAP